MCDEKKDCEIICIKETQNEVAQMASAFGNLWLGQCVCSQQCPGNSRREHTRRAKSRNRMRTSVSVLWITCIWRLIDCLPPYLFASVDFGPHTKVYMTLLVQGFDHIEKVASPPSVKLCA